MMKLVLEGYIVREGNDMESRLFFYSGRPDRIDGEFCSAHDGDNVFRIDLPIKDFVSLNEPRWCKITVELEK